MSIQGNKIETSKKEMKGTPGEPKLANFWAQSNIHKKYSSIFAKLSSEVLLKESMPAVENTALYFCIVFDLLIFCQVVTIPKKVSNVQNF